MIGKSGLGGWGRNYKGSQCKSQMTKSYERSRPIVTFPADRNQPIRGCSIGNLKQTEQNEVKKTNGLKEKKNVGNVRCGEKKENGRCKENIMSAENYKK